MEKKDAIGELAKIMMSAVGGRDDEYAKRLAGVFQGLCGEENGDEGGQGLGGW